MSITLAEYVLASTDADKGIVLFPCGDGRWALRYLQLTHEQAASILYQMADEIVDQHIPPPDWRQRIK